MKSWETEFGGTSAPRIRMARAVRSPRPTVHVRDRIQRWRIGWGIVCLILETRPGVQFCELTAQVAKTGMIQQLETLGQRLDRLPSLMNAAFGDGSEPAGGAGEVCDPPGIDSHEPRRRGVD